VSCRIKTLTTESGDKISKGQAVVSFQKKEDAVKAMKNLYFEDELGDRLDVDFFHSKDERQQKMLQHTVDTPINE
jgi:hypothetical protein